MPRLMIRRGKSDKAEVDGYALGHLLREYGADVLFVELVGGMTGESASSSFNFGRAAGAPEYAAKALGLRVERVPPTVWRRDLNVKNGKDGSVERASTLWPAMSHRFAAIHGNGPQAVREGRAEAALIAEWGRRQMESEHGQGRGDRGVPAGSPGGGDGTDIFA
jgi:hypothetical protein